MKRPEFMVLFFIVFFYLLFCGAYLPIYIYQNRKSALSKAYEELKKQHYQILSKTQGYPKSNSDSKLIDEIIEQRKTEYHDIVVKKSQTLNEIKKINSEREELMSQLNVINEMYQERQDVITNFEQKKSELSDSISTLKIEYDELINTYQKVLDQLNLFENGIQQEINQTEKAWRDKIENGNLPENITLTQKNRRCFFIYMKLSEKESDDTATYTSEHFGNAKDAKKFADHLENLLKILCRTRETERKGEYVVYAEHAPTYIMDKFYYKQDLYEFVNPTFDENEDNLEIISDEERAFKAFSYFGQSYQTGVEYEQFVAEYLGSMGYTNIERTPVSGDFGADIICEKDGMKYCIQCKMYANPVGVSAIQEVCAAKAHYKSDQAAVITNNVFTQQAKRLASENGIILIENFK